MDPPGEAGHARRERSLRFGQATLLVVIAVVISCCGFGANALRPRPTATATATATSGTAPITGSVVLSADRHTIYYTDADGPCRRPNLSADDSGGSVRLSLSYYSPTLCLRGDDVLPAVTARVAVPDLLQSFVDAGDGHAIPTFRQAGALHPSHLPTGLIAGTTSLYGDVGSAAPTFGGAGSATMTETFADAESAFSPSSNARLWVVQTTGTWTPPAGIAPTTVAVRGHLGRAAPGIIVWREDGVTVAIFWTFARDIPAPSTASLVAIANDLVRTATT
jgi:hypothetical protein